MSLPISIKVEKAIAGWLPGVLNITGMNYYEGHEKAESVATPHLVIYSEGSTPYAETPPECGIRQVRLRCKFTVDSDDTSRSSVNDWKQKLESAITDDLDTLKAALNKPVGTDNRTIKAIHFHHVSMSDDPSEHSQTDWVEDLIFDVVCELLDA